MDVHTYKSIIQITCTSMFKASLITLAKTWKQPTCPKTGEWITNFVIDSHTHTHTQWNTSQPSVYFNHSVVSDSLRPHEPQHTRPPCPSPTPRVYPNLCPLCWWCHPTISYSVILFSLCPQSFPASGSFQWVSYSHQVAKLLEFQLQYQSFQWTPRTDLL